MSEAWESMTVAELKEELRARELPVSGTKKDLIARLVESADDSTSSEQEVLDVEADLEEDLAEEDFEDATWDDEWDDDEDDDYVHVAKQKPVLDEATKAALDLRTQQKKATPSFRRTEWFRYKRLSRSGWRKPKGMDNKQRRNFKYRSSLVRVGHGKVAAARGLHPSGFQEVMVHTLNDLDGIDPETQAARIGRTVGGRRRELLHERADELGVRVLNRRRDV